MWQENIHISATRSSRGVFTGDAAEMGRVRRPRVGFVSRHTEASGDRPGSTMGTGFAGHALFDGAQSARLTGIHSA